MNGLKNKFVEYFELIKFEHTIFALPFAMTGMLLADVNSIPSFNTFVLVLLAMVGGRTAAMALNRVIDADIDKLNPRTGQRAIPAGKIKKASALILVLVSFIVMIMAVFQLPAICIKLLPPAIFILVIYSYTKRFTKMCHFVLGAALGAAASGGWLAVSGELTIPVAIWGLAIVFWVGGFDIIYALQDIEFDKEHNLHSIPAKFGIQRSLLISRIFHIITIVLLTVLGIIYEQIQSIGYFYFAAVLITGMMLVYEHYLLRDNNLSKVDTAFFNVNGYISICFMSLVLIGKVI